MKKYLFVFCFLLFALPLLGQGYDYENSYYQFAAEIVNYEGQAPPLQTSTAGGQSHQYFEYVNSEGNRVRNDPAVVADVWQTYLELFGDSDFTLIKYVNGHLLASGKEFVGHPVFHHAWMEYSIAQSLLEKYNELGWAAAANLSPKGMRAWYKSGMTAEQFDLDMLARAANPGARELFLTYIQDSALSYLPKTEAGVQKLTELTTPATLESIRDLIGKPAIFGGIESADGPAVQRLLSGCEHMKDIAAFLRADYPGCPDYVAFVEGVLIELEGETDGGGVIDLKPILERLNLALELSRDNNKLLKAVLAEIAAEE